MTQQGHPTTGIPKIPDWAIAFAEKLEAMRAEARASRQDICEHLHKLDTRTETLLHEAETQAKWRGEMESWRSRSSDRAKQPSAHDLESAAALAVEVVERKKVDDDTTKAIERIEQKADVAIGQNSKLLAIAKDPKVIAFFGLLALILERLAERHGLL